MRYMHERTVLSMPDPVVSFVEAITQADTATKQAVLAITGMLPPSATTQHIERACNNVQPSASITAQVLVPAAPVQEGEVGQANQRRRDSDVALLKILVANAPNDIFKHLGVQELCVHAGLCDNANRTGKYHTWVV